jgi:D-sedoheptulose 7-phosphate isomerase
MQDHIRESIAVKERLLKDETFLRTLGDVTRELRGVYERGGKLLIAGNGGSAADAQHFAAEITCQFKETRKGYPALALHTDTSAMTAWGNDKSFDTVFARQVEAHGKTGDALVVISTSGNSKNLIEATKQARSQGVRVVGLLGRDGGELVRGGYCDYALVVPSEETPRIQESHILLIHIICDALDKFFVTLER